jgi:hypothetical protein
MYSNDNLGGSVLSSTCPSFLRASSNVETAVLLGGSEAGLKESTVRISESQFLIVSSSFGPNPNSKIPCDDES